MDSRSKRAATSTPLRISPILRGSRGSRSDVHGVRGEGRVRVRLDRAQVKMAPNLASLGTEVQSVVCLPSSVLPKTVYREVKE